MPLNQEQILEIQLSAEYLTKKRIKETQEQREYKETLADKIAEAKAPRRVKEESGEVESKKGK